MFCRFEFFYVVLIWVDLHQMAMTCCTISLTLIHQLYPITLQNIQTPTTTVSLLQLVSGEHLVVTSYTVLSASQTRWQVHCFITNCSNSKSLNKTIIEMNLFSALKFLFYLVHWVSFLYTVKVMIAATVGRSWL